MINAGYDLTLWRLFRYVPLAERKASSKQADSGEIAA
jgi:hypothetical protein